MLKQVAGFLPIDAVKGIRSADKALCRLASAVVKHVKVNNAGDLVAALEVYKEGGITKITLGNAHDPDSGVASFRDEHLALL